MDVVNYLQEKGWVRADIIINSGKLTESYENKELDYFSELPVKVIELIKETEYEMTFLGYFVFMAPIVAAGEETPALSREETEVKLIFRRR